MTYDDYGRLTSEQWPDGSQTTVYRAWCTASTCPAEGELKVLTLSDGAPATVVVADLLGREIVSAQEGFSGEVIITATQYDNEGRVAANSLPYMHGETPQWVVLGYDDLGRVTSEARPGAGGEVIDTAIEYSALTVETTNDKGHTTTEHFTLRGELDSVIDAEGTSTQYWYDAFGNLRQTEVDGNAATRIVNTFDVRGRKRTMYDPDMALGGVPWEYDYNGFGEIERQADGKSQVMDLEYDVLGRVVERGELEGATTFEYDTAAHGLGLIAETDAAEGETKTFAYDSLSRPRQVTTMIAGEGTFVTDREYDPVDGRLRKLTYPASPAYPLGLRVRYEYNTHGYLREVRNDDAGNALIWRRDAATLDATSVTFGNDVTATQSFVRETGTVETIQASSPGQSNDVQDLTYAFDTLGNLTLREDENRDVLERSGLYQSGTLDSYDGLNRLTRVERELGGVSQQVNTYGYDALGNLTSKSDLGNYDYATHPAGCAVASGPHAVKQVDVGSGALQAFCYDANGNQTEGYHFAAGRSRTLTWTSYDKPATITEAGQTVSFAYGADRSRFKQENTFTDETTVYVDGIYEREDVGTLDVHRHYIVAGGTAVAVYESASDGIETTRYLHRDHLGSVVEVTDEDGLVAESFSYDAWGRRRDPVDWSDALGPVYASETKRGHTGHEQLDDVGLVHMNGRVQDPALGRVLSADPYVQYPRHSQSYNRYSYVLNNPLTQTDPSGYCTAAGPSCPSGGYVPGLGGSLGGVRSPPIKRSFSYRVEGLVTAIELRWGRSGIFAGRGPGSGACYLAGGCLPSTAISLDGSGGGFGFGFDMPFIVVTQYYVSFSYTKVVAPAYGPLNKHVGAAWLGKLWGRFGGLLISDAMAEEGNPSGNVSSRTATYMSWEEYVEYARTADRTSEEWFAVWSSAKDTQDWVLNLSDDEARRYFAYQGLEYADSVKIDIAQESMRKDLERWIVRSAGPAAQHIVGSAIENAVPVGRATRIIRRLPGQVRRWFGATERAYEMHELMNQDTSIGWTCGRYEGGYACVPETPVR